MTWLLPLLWIARALAGQPAPVPPSAIPAELRDWVAWTTTAHPEWACPVIDGEAACLWPGRLTVEVGPDAARLRLGVHADRELLAPLPGGAGTWPQEVLVDGRPAVVLDRTGPAVALSAGEHVVAWTIPWTTRPPRLPVPPTLALIDLVVDGVVVRDPQRDDDGSLRLGVVESARATGDGLELEAHRHVLDAVPVRVETRVTLRVSGSAREERLGAIGLPGTRPVELSANLPARLDPDGTLVVQVRPGTFELTLTALHEGPAASLAPPALPAPWPDTETWVVQTDDRVRAVQLSGPPGVDPSRTSLPADWRGLPAFLVSPTTPLTLTELRRGEPVPPPNELHLRRELWLDHDGQGWTLQDAFDGAMNEAWRLDVLPPMALGHLVAGGEDQVITAHAGLAGAELRAASVAVVADSRIDAPARTLPAVGWDTEVSHLSATLHLPPGYRLLGAWGVDEVHGGATEWNLLDLFFVVLVALAVRRLTDARWAAVALVGLVVSHHEQGAPMWSWVAVLVTLALHHALPEGRGRGVAAVARSVSLLVLLVILVPFALAQVQGGLFPVLEAEDGGGHHGSGGGLAMRAAAPMSDASPAMEALDELPDRYTRLELDGGSNVQRLTKQKDAAAVVQTGPGIPSWSFHRHELGWDGPVTPDHELRLWIVGPLGNLVLSALRVGLLLALALRLSELRRLSTRWMARAAPVALALLVAAPARATPDATLRAELEARLGAAPACRPACVTVSTADLSIEGTTLTVSAEVHALEASSWTVPGPTSAWVPSLVTLDGATTTALARMPDGFLHARVPPGVHRLTAVGPLPATGALALQLGLLPRRLSFTADGWSLQGVKADGTVEGAVQLLRDAGETPEAARSAVQPWVEVERFVDLGIPWRVRTTLTRRGPTEQPIALRVPLLPGESVTDGGLQVDAGHVLVTLGNDEATRAWESSLETVDQLLLTAPSGVPWTEVWTLSCSPLFRCAPSGLPPLFHLRDDVWSPLYRPWPGESLTLDVSRPDAVEGQTVTVDRASLRWTPGVRSAEGDLTLSVRTSQGGQQTIRLPDGARLQAAMAKGTRLPVSLRDGAVVLPLTPGTQELQVTWQQPVEASVVHRVPEIDIGSPAVNVEVTVQGTSGRWLLWLGGPRVGPVVLFWLHLVAVLIAAPLLARVPVVPLRTASWALLMAGFAHLHVLVALPVVLTMVALGVRSRWHPRRALPFAMLQLALVGAVLVSVGCLYAAVHAGLLWTPEMQVAGNDSYDTWFVWFSDRTGSTLIQPVVVSLPMWVWRVVMLAWASWLAWSLVRWARWAWDALSHGGLVRPEPPPAAEPAP